MLLTMHSACAKFVIEITTQINSTLNVFRVKKLCRGMPYTNQHSPFTFSVVVKNISNAAGLA